MNKINTQIKTEDVQALQTPALQGYEGLLRAGEEKIKAILSKSIEELRKVRYVVLPRDECDAFRLADPKTEKGKLWTALVYHLLDAWGGSHLEMDDIFLKLCRAGGDC